MKLIAKKIYALFASFGLAVILFMLMFVLILLGTLYQVDHGLYEAQKRYFTSVIAYHQVGPLVVPLPGAYTVMALLGVNIILGGLVRIRKSWKRPGVIIVHVGILVLIASAAITFHFSDRGNMALYPTEVSDEFQSYNDWSIEIRNADSDEPAFVIDDTAFKDLRAGESRSFFADGLPFEIALSDYRTNAMPLPVPPDMLSVENAIDGYVLEAAPPEKEVERNVPGVIVTAVQPETNATTTGILYGGARHPWTARFGDDAYTIALLRKRYPVPFTVTLDDFKMEMHPGTGMAASYESYITKTENGKDEKVRVWMNHPLRRKGLTFFQASWGPQNAPPGAPLFTVFEVVRNPADQGPLVACIIVSIGFLIHFLQKLLGYIRTENKRRTA